MELEKAAASVPAHDEESAAAIEHRLAAVQERLGNWAAAGAHLEVAAGLARSDPVLRARVDADRAFVAFRCGDPGAGALAEAALAGAEEAGDAAAVAQAHNVAGMLAALAGDHERAERELRRSLEVAGELDEPGASVAALNNLAQVLHESGTTERGLELAEEALRRGVEHGDVHRVAALHSNLADLLHAAGRTDEALAHLKESAAGFAALDVGDEVSPGVWTLTRW